jgi:ribonuclease BN (tRNA processing enzyme)
MAPIYTRLREDAGMRLHVIGCSPAWQNPGGAQSGYLVELDGRRLLLDCGPGVLPRLREREGWPRVDAIVISHFHLDHWGDVLPWAFGALSGPGRGEQRPELWLPPGGAESLRRLEPALFTGPVFDVFDVHEYAEATPFTAAGFSLTAFGLLHYGSESFGLRVADGETVLAYGGDSAPCAKLVELARDADLFLCEATLAEPEPGERGHLTAEEAIAAATEASARRLLIVHRPVELPVPDGVERAYDGYATEV